MFTSNRPVRQVLIASSHPLFAQGLRSLLQARHGMDVSVVGVVSSLSEAIAAIDRLNPDLVIVDYDDQALNRDEFLARFVEGEKKLRVVLLSLQSGGEALVYDRRTLSASQIDNWLEEWTLSEQSSKGSQRNQADGLRRNLEKNAHNRSMDMKRYVHLAIAAVLVVVIAVLLMQVLTVSNLLPVAASEQAKPIDSLFDIEFKVISFLFSLIIVFMVYSVVVFRRKKGDTSDAAHIEGNTTLEILWTLAPLATVLYFAYLGGASLADTLKPDDFPLEVKVVGQQWSWRFIYNEGQADEFQTTELILPVDRQTLLHLISNDVIHSFWVPEFRVKQDALPGGEDFVRDLRITPNKVADYKVRCAELCGTSHAFMESPVKVMTKADFDTWFASQTGESADPVERGAKVAQLFACTSCHSQDGSALIGPTWKGLFGNEIKLADGSTVTANDEYLYESITNPNAKIHDGFQPNLMPQNFSTTMSEKQILDVIEYIKSLK